MICDVFETIVDDETNPLDSLTIMAWADALAEAAVPYARGMLWLAVNKKFPARGSHGTVALWDWYEVHPDKPRTCDLPLNPSRGRWYETWHKQSDAYKQGAIAMTNLLEQEDYRANHHSAYA